MKLNKKNTLKLTQTNNKTIKHAYTPIKQLNNSNKT